MELKAAGCAPESNTADVYRRLLQVSMMRGRELIATVVSHQHREDVLEIFLRLNSRGMRFRRLVLKLVMRKSPPPSAV